MRYTSTSDIMATTVHGTCLLCIHKWSLQDKHCYHCSTPGRTTGPHAHMSSKQLREVSTALVTQDARWQGRVLHRQENCYQLQTHLIHGDGLARYHGLMTIDGIHRCIYVRTNVHTYVCMYTLTGVRTCVCKYAEIHCWLVLTSAKSE